MSRLLRLVLAVGSIGLVAGGPQPPLRVEPAACTTTRPVPFGCANRVNLRTSVAEPADLVHGRAASPAMAALDVAAIERLRSDEVKPLVGAGTDYAPGAGAPR